MTLLAHFPAYRVLVASALGVLVAPAALAKDAAPTVPAAKPAAPSATLPPVAAPAPAPQAPAPAPAPAKQSLAPAATAPLPAGPAPAAPAPAAPPASENPDAYLDADFPNAAQVEVAPPVASSRRTARVGSESSPPPVSYTDSGYEEPRRRKPLGPKATERGPFFFGGGDLLIAADYYNMISGGIGGGTFLKDRFRLAGTLMAPLEFTADSRGDVDSPEISFGANAGIALVRRQVFALSLVADVSTTNSSDLGWNVGLAMPLDWVTRGGFRVGIMPGIFQNFGTSAKLDCEDYTYDYESGRTYCGEGTARPETGVHVQFHLGFTLK